MDEQHDELDIELRVFFAAAKRQISRHNEDQQNRIFMDAVHAYPPFDSFRGALADFGSDPAMTGLATAAFISANLRFSAPEWSQSMSAWLNTDISFDSDLADPFEGLDYSFLESNT